MKKLISISLAIIMLASMLLTLISCADNNGKKFVSVDASDLLKEDFGIAVKKGDTETLAAVNAVVDKWVKDGTMSLYLDYYEALAKGETPDAKGLKTSWDFGDATETLTVYTESGFAPFEFVYEGKIVGVDIAIMSEVAANNNMKLEVKDVLFDTIPLSVKNSSTPAVGAAGLTINDERKEMVDFSNIYFSSTLVIVSAEDKAISSVKDLSGLKVGVQEGTSGDLIISAAATSDGYTYEGDDGDVVVKVNSSTKVTQYKQYSLALADLKAGRIDAILMDKLPAQTMLAVTD